MKDDDMIGDGAANEISAMIDPVRRILAELSETVGKTRSHDHQKEIIEAALHRLRALYTQSKHLFTSSVLNQIADFKALIAPVDHSLPPEASAQRRAIEVEKLVKTCTVESPICLPAFMTVGRVLQVIGTEIRRAFPAQIWIKGEVSDFKLATSGHVYFSLVERPVAGAQQVLPAAIWKSTRERLEKKMSEAGVSIVAGQEMLFFGTLSLYENSGKLHFNISDVFPEFTLGQIEMQRRAVLSRLRQEGLTEMNKKLQLADLPLRIALVSSRNSDGRRDFQKTLQKSPYAFDIFPVDVAVQGPNVEAVVCRALEVLAIKHRELNLDAVCIVRGGGSAVDLNWWNNYSICSAIAKMPVPVITGIGHERDRVAADEVAHTAAATPTAAAEFLCRIMRTAETDLKSAREAIVHLAFGRIGKHNITLQSISRWVPEQIGFISAAQQRKQITLRDQLLAHARRALVSHATTLNDCSRIVAVSPSRFLQIADRTLDTIARQIALISTAELKKADAQTNSMAHQFLAHAARALHQHTSVWKISARILSDEPLRVILSMERTLDVNSRQIQFASETNLNRARMLAKGSVSDLYSLVTRHIRVSIANLSQIVGEVFSAVTAAVRAEDTQVCHLLDLVAAHDPESVLRRGFSITFDEDGRAIKDAESLALGTTIVTQLGQGRVRSSVTKRE